MGKLHEFVSLCADFTNFSASEEEEELVSAAAVSLRAVFLPGIKEKGEKKKRRSFDTGVVVARRRRRGRQKKSRRGRRASVGRLVKRPHVNMGQATHRGWSSPRRPGPRTPSEPAQRELAL